uniref:Uncharacterized protein n=1 Tax=Panagrolaimus sp. PS1159 TaxID=55785 RepID=A0AC35F701_9BILA
MSDLRNANSTVSSLKRKAKDSMIVPSKRLRFNGFYLVQNWSLPYLTIIYYIATKCSSSNVYQKLIKSCKYFFAKNPLSICKDLFYCEGEWLMNDGDPKDLGYNDSSKRYWITHALYVTPIFCNKQYPRIFCTQQDLASLILPKIYQCDATEVYIKNQIVFCDEIMIIGSKAEKVNFHSVTVQQRDGTLVPLEKLVQLFPKLRSFSYNSPTISSETFKNLLQIPHFLAMDQFQLHNVSENFDIECFYDYMKINNRTQFRLNFATPISHAYKDRLNQIIDEIIQTTNHGYKPAFITFRYCSREKFYNLLAIVNR